MRIILDTSSIISALDWRIDLFDELVRIYGNPSFAIVEPTLQELEKLSRKKRAYKVAFEMLKACEVIKGEGHADNVIVANAGNGTAVLTQDALLKKRLKDKGAIVLTIRQKKFVVLA